jgi:hypothetical protein
MPPSTEVRPKFPPIGKTNLGGSLTPAGPGYEASALLKLVSKPIAEEDKRFKSQNIFT